MNNQEKNAPWLSADSRGNATGETNTNREFGTNLPSSGLAGASDAVARHLDWRRGSSSDISAATDTLFFANDARTTMTTSRAMTTINDPDEFDLEMHAEGDTLFVSGDIDLHQAAQFGERAEQHIRQSEEPRLDLTGVLFLDSAGLAMLLSLSKLAKTQDKPLRLLATGSPRRVLRITGIDRVLIVED